MSRLGGRAALFHLIHYFHSCADLAEHRITPALCCLVLVIQKCVVADIDEELRCGGVGIGGTGHGHGADGVEQTIVGFVGDRLAVGLLNEASFEATALDHKVVDNPVKDSVVVKTALGVLKEIGCRNRGFFEVEFDSDITVIRFKDNHCVQP